MNSATKKSSLASDTAPSTIPANAVGTFGPTARNADIRTTGSAQASPQLNIRSCVTCRRRKVRCDKQQPCSNCEKGRIECIFPGPARAPRKSKKSPDSELLARLRRLERVVQSLSAQVVDSDAIPSATISPANDEKEKRQGNQKQRSCYEGMPGQCPGNMDSDPTRVVPHALDQEFGRLVIGDGESRYVSNRFWASFGDEVMIQSHLSTAFCS